MKTPNAQDQVAALLDLIPEPSPIMERRFSSEVAESSVPEFNGPTSAHHIVGYDPAFDAPDESVEVVYVNGKPELIVDDPLPDPCILCGSYSHHTDDCLQPLVHEPRDVSHLRQRTITAHTVALVTTLLALGDHTIGPRVIDEPQEPIPPTFRRPIRDVFGIQTMGHTRARFWNDPRLQSGIETSEDRARIEKAEAKRRRKAARLEAQQRKRT